MCIFNTHFRKVSFKGSVHHSWIISEMRGFVQKVSSLTVRFQKWSHTSGSQGPAVATRMRDWDRSAGEVGGEKIKVWKRSSL